MIELSRLARWAGTLSLIAVSLAAGFAGGFTAARVEFRSALEATDLLREALGLLERNHFNDLPDTLRLQRGMIRGLVGSLGDPYTTYQSPSQDELESQTLQGAYGGIGALLQPVEGGYVLVPYPDGPAWRAGVLEGDHLLQIDDFRLGADELLADISAALRGEPGTYVTIRIARGAQPDEQTFEIERQIIPLPSVTVFHHPQADGVTVVAVTNFSQSTPEEIRQGLLDPANQHTTVWILDLRNNPGGLLDAAIETADLFLTDGLILTEWSREGVVSEHRAQASADDFGAPLVVLINGGTASAAEVVAGALGDNQRAPLFGQSTYGKGSVQSIYGLSDGSNLHITTARWFTPGGRQLDDIGLTPTVLVEPDPALPDPIMSRAIDWLQQNGWLP
jgi:carboxyl-terminal processing protease